MLTTEHTPAPKRQIAVAIDRVPFNKRGEVVVRQKETDTVVASHTMDKLFEVSSIVVTLTALAENAVCDPQPTVLDRLISIEVTDPGRAQSLGVLVLSAETGPGVYFWSPKKPIVMQHNDALQFRVIGRDSFDIAFDGARKRIDAIRVEVTLEGELVEYTKATFEGEAPLPG